MLENGESVRLEIAAEYLMRDVAFDISDVEFTVTGGVGSVDSEGVFTATSEGAATVRLT